MPTIRYLLNGDHIDGWDEVDHDTIDLDAAASNLTDVEPGDTLTAQLVDEDANGQPVVVEEQSRRL